MTLKYADRVSETTATTGTGTYSLAGAKDSYQSFVDGIGNSNTCYYCCTDGTDWEAGLGTVTDADPDTLSRDAILSSSNGGAAVDWAAGTKAIFCTLPADKTLLVDGDGHAHLGDNKKLLLGDGDDASIYYNGSHLFVDPQEVGSGKIVLPTGAFFLWGDPDTSSEYMWRPSANVIRVSCSLYGYGWRNYSYGTEAAPADSYANDNDTGTYRPAADEIGVCTGSHERMRFDDAGNVIIGAKACDTTATNGLAIAAGTAPAGSPADMVHLWVEDVGGAGQAELRVRDEQGNVTTLSPHDSDAPPAMYNEKPGIEAVVGYYNMFRGEIRWVNLEDPTKGKIIETFAEYNTRMDGKPNKRPGLKVEDWNANEEKKRIQREADRAKWEEEKAEYDAFVVWRDSLPEDDRPEPVSEPKPKPKPYTKKQNPFAESHLEK